MNAHTLELYLASVSDQHVLICAPILQQMQAGDVLFLDSGFQIPVDPQKQIKLGIPAGVVIVQPNANFPAERQCQSAIQAVVESIAGKLKAFRIFNHITNTSSRRTIQQMVNVVVGLIVWEEKQSPQHRLRNPIASLKPPPTLELNTALLKNSLSSIPST